MKERRTAVVAFGLLMVAGIGCDARRPKKFTTPEDWERYAAVPFASATHHAELRAELARVAAEGGTPAQLASASGTVLPADSPAGTIFAELTEIFPADSRDALVARLQSLYPDSRFQFAPLVRGTARELLQASNARRDLFQRRMLARPLLPVFQHARGIGADIAYLTAVEAGNRLSGMYIAELLDTDRLPQAVESLDAMFRAAEWLSREKHPVPRIAGAERRAEAFVALGAVARHPQASPAIRGQLRELVTRQLDNWPPDADAWLGERAEGLHTYELIRDGYLLSILPFENLRRLRQEIGVDKLGQVVADHLDADELFFLTALRQVIGACSNPYYQRREVLQRISDDLERLRSSDQYPFVADQLLLVELDERQRLVAQDRARCAAWQIAFSLAAGEGAPADVLNPLTGTPFSIGHAAGNIVVDGIGNSEPRIEIPLEQPTAAP